MSAITLSTIFANVSAAKSAELSNEQAFIRELLDHSGQTPNARNITFYLNAMSVKQLGSMSVFRDFLLKYTNFEIGFADSKTKVLSNGDFIKQEHASYADASTYTHWFREQLTAAGLADDAAAVPASIIYVCRGFKSKPKDAKSDAAQTVRDNREKAQAEWEFRKDLWEKFGRNEPIELVVAYDRSNLDENNKPSEVKATVEGYNGSISAFMSRLATLTRSAKLALARNAQTDEQKLTAAQDSARKALAKLAALSGGDELIRELFAEQVATQVGEGQYAVYSRTANGGLSIPVICTMTSEGHYIQVEDSAE